MWKEEWVSLRWDNLMDRHNNKTHIVCEVFNSYYILNTDDDGYRWGWHHDWLAPVDKDGNPFDNQHNEFCHWCKEKIIRFEDFNYCPKCLR